MRSLLTALALTLLAFTADATSLRARYGHYYATGYGDNPTGDVQTLCGIAGVTGINYRARWKDLEPTQGTFVWTTWDTVISTIQGMVGPTTTSSGVKPNNTCALWLLPEWKLFSLTAGGANGNPCPSWLKDANGNPGWAPNDQATGSKIVNIATGAASVTNASPIVITLSSANMTTLGIANGDTVFVDLVAGNKAANGSWVVASKTATTISLQGSHGNGTRQQSGTPTGWFGRVSKGASMDCKMWDPTVRARFNELITAMGAHFNASATVEGFILQESSISMSASGYSYTVSNGGDYTTAGYTTSIISYIGTCGTAFPAARCMDFINQIQGGGLDEFIQVSDALHALSDNQGCYSGPDILPKNQGLINGTYQALVKHVGCRSNSAQNTTIVGTPAGSSNMACDVGNCNNVFKFTVQGAFGQLGTKNAAGNYITTPTDGLCVNSYIFWNNSTAEQAKVTPTIQANPYGVQWYGQCICGGAAP